MLHSLSVISTVANTLDGISTFFYFSDILVHFLVFLKSISLTSELLLWIDYVLENVKKLPLCWERVEALGGKDPK